MRFKYEFSCTKVHLIKKTLFKKGNLETYGTFKIDLPAKKQNMSDEDAKYLQRRLIVQFLPYSSQVFSAMTSRLWQEGALKKSTLNNVKTIKT